MNKTAIKNFAIWARNKLIADIVYQAGLLGITEKGIASALPQSTREVQFFDIGTKDYMTLRGNAIQQRDAFVVAIKDKQENTSYAEAFRYVVEKVAYTWFNRLIAIRFMEVNDYLPGRVRVLSSENPGKAEPDMVTRPFDTDLSFSALERDEIMRMKDENKLDELFRMLFIKQCQKLNEVLPSLFDPKGIERADSYLELLLTISFTDKDGVLWHLTHDISEDDFNVEKEGQVEIIGWMYQYYNTEPKDQVFANLKKNIKISKDNIPAATQLFTPDWIVRYMVENSLGRLWVEGHPNEELKKNWKYYLDEAEQEPQVQDRLSEIRKQYAVTRPDSIKVVDPCMGSGHILVYLFDVLMQIYESQGWIQREAAQSIVKNNLYGLDIDDRAAQLSYFAVMMKARQYDRRFLERGIMPHVYGIQESNDINRDQIKLFGKGMSTLEKNNAINQLIELLNALRDAKDYGSILSIPQLDWDLLIRYTEGIDDTEQISMESVGADETCEQIKELIEQAKIMACKYDIVVTNPPYMGSSGMGAKLSEYVKTFYPNGKLDLFACFIDKCHFMTKDMGFVAMITPQAFMFLGSYEKLRDSILNISTYISMAHMGYGTFGNDFGTTAFVISKIKASDYISSFVQLGFTRDIEEKRGALLDICNGSSQHLYQICQDQFYDIPGHNTVYWISERFLDILKNAQQLADVATIRVGMHTGNNEIFVREWFEVDYKKICLTCTSHNESLNRPEKWYPYNKGGGNRRWYGYRTRVVNWQYGGADIHRFHNLPMDYHGAPVRAKELQFKEGITWSDTGSTGIFAARYSPIGCMFDVKGSSAFTDAKYLYYILGFLNVGISTHILNMFNPTITYQVGNISTLPFLFDIQKAAEIDELVKENISISKANYDCKELSWEFKKHPLVVADYITNGKESILIKEQYDLWKTENIKSFTRMKANETQLNNLFIDIYGLQDEMESELSDDAITIDVADVERDIKALISYAVGCMFGRYSLDIDGLAYAGGNWDTTKYIHFQPDTDNCIPITDEAYFDDDIVGRFVEFIRIVYGPNTLEENLDFVAKSLGSKGNSSREIIRNYFLNDFFRDHCVNYTVTGSGKRPIYWLFDSGKQNGFKALVYMHRWNADTVGNLRVEYLHRMQRVYEKEIDRMQDIIDNGKDNREVNQASKRREKLVKQLKEARDYDAKIAHAALSRVEIDLDDGVKANYEKVQKGPDGKSLEILAKI